MKLILGLGNPGVQYHYTRHNIGFMFADMLASTWQAEFAEKPKFRSYIAQTTRHGEKIMIVKPTTFYNDSGIAARALIDFYKLVPERDLMVIHDEIALPFGTLRTREKGRDAGNNGVKSLNSHIGEQHKRLRVGIYQPLRDQMHDADFVLGKFDSAERRTLPDLFAAALPLIDGFTDGDLMLTKLTVPQAGKAD